MSVVSGAIDVHPLGFGVQFQVCVCVVAGMDCRHTHSGRSPGYWCVLLWLLCLTTGVQYWTPVMGAGLEVYVCTV